MSRRFARHLVDQSIKLLHGCFSQRPIVAWCEAYRI